MLCHPIKNRTLALLVLATLPAVAFTLFLGDALDKLLGGWFLGPAFFVTALFMFLADRAAKRERPRTDEVTEKTALLMGAFQAIAILPGVSRSGSTVLGGLTAGLTRKKAAAFSFMMSAPAILGGFVLEVKDALDAGGISSLVSAPILLGVLVSALVGYAAIRFMLNVIEHKRLRGFSYYLIALGAFVIVCQLTGFLGFAPLF